MTPSNGNGCSCYRISWEVQVDPVGMLSVFSVFVQLCSRVVMWSGRQSLYFCSSVMSATMPVVNNMCKYVQAVWSKCRERNCYRAVTVRSLIMLARWQLWLLPPLLCSRLLRLPTVGFVLWNTKIWVSKLNPLWVVPWFCLPGVMVLGTRLVPPLCVYIKRVIFLLHLRCI